MPTNLILDKKTLLGNGSFAYVYRGFLILRGNRMKKTGARRSSEAAEGDDPEDDDDRNENKSIQAAAASSSSKVATKRTREGKEIAANIRQEPKNYQRVAIDRKQRRNSDSDCFGAGEAHVSYESKPVAVKRIELVHVRSSEDREETVLRDLDHRNVVKVFHVENDKHFSRKKKYNGPQLPPDLTVLRQLSQGLAYIHSKKIVHRDIRPQNALISADSNNVVTLKWASFRSSKTVSEQGSFGVSAIRGNRSWLAPELLEMLSYQDVGQTGENFDSRFEGNSMAARATLKSDVFAEGMVFAYYLLKGFHPFGWSQLDIPVNIVQNQPIHFHKLESSRDATLVSIIRCMLADQVDCRISSQEVAEQLHQLDKAEANQ